MFGNWLTGLPAPTIAGVASITDGDTIRIGDHRIRLHGIDAPELDQRCVARDGRSWPCGREATRALRTLVGAEAVSCHQEDVDRYGRIVARCFVGERDLAEQLVRQGLALAYRRYSDMYVPAERDARSAGRGLWGGDVEPPWAWRRRQATG